MITRSVFSVAKRPPTDSRKKTRDVPNALNTFRRRVLEDMLIEKQKRRNEDLTN